MNNDLKIYVENMKKPWSVMYYKLAWEQLGELNNYKILDFGSGLGITASHLAKDNKVTAIEPNSDMLEVRERENYYQQIKGNINELKQLKDDSYDLVICHNVLEYAKERKDLLREFYRVLKPEGKISIIKHNHEGRIMSKISFENNLDEALALINEEPAYAAYFGEVNYYNINDVREWINDLNLSIEKILGIRALFGLHSNNEVRYDPIWQKKMFEIEMKVSDIDCYKNIAFFNHILLKKTDKRYENK